MEFLDLPLEMVQHVASFLDADSLLALSTTCHQLDHIGHVDSLWAALCLKDYKVQSIDGWKLSYRDIYLKVLKEWHIFGLKRLALLPYGGLVHVCWAEGEIQINEYTAVGRNSPGDLLSCDQLYSIRWDESEEKLKAYCVQGEQQTTDAEILQTGTYPLVRCKSKDCFKTHRQRRRRGSLFELGSNHGQSDPNFKPGFEDHPLAFNGFKLKKGFNCPMLPLPDIHPKDGTVSPVQLGFYTGDYGAHGKEIIYLTLNSSGDTPKLEGLKIVGDPNVPAGYVSLFVDLNKPIVLTEDDQASTDQLIQLDEARPQEAYDALLGDEALDMRQPYRTPDDCFERAENVTSRCIARYLGHGRIAGHYYRHPSLCRVHFIKFSDILFGAVWLDLSSFSLFYRVNQDFNSFKT